MKNKYCYRSKLSEAKFRQIVRYFSEDLNASICSKLANLNRNTVNKYYNIFREIILENTTNRENFEKFSRVIEVDESYFGYRRGRGAGNKVPVIGVLKRGGKIYTEIVQNCTKAELMPVIQGKVLEGSTVNTDGWKSYNSLIINGYKHYRVFSIQKTNLSEENLTSMV